LIITRCRLTAADATIRLWRPSYKWYILLSWFNTLRSYLNLYFFPVFVLACGPLGAATATAPDAIVQSYWMATQQQERALAGASMEVDIKASLPKLKKQGRLRALRRISRLGRITYEALHFEGDNAVKNHVIAKYLAAEVEAQAEGAESFAVTPANYKFAYHGVAEHDGETVHVFEVSPRRKRVGLFKGEIWIDAQSFLLVRESGRMVKTPSFFLKNIEFVREFQIQDGVSVPRQLHTVAETRLVGPAELTIDFRNVSLGAGPRQASVVDVDEQ